MNITVGVLALQGAFFEHVKLLKSAAAYIYASEKDSRTAFAFTEVRNAAQLALCDALIIPGGESTTISLVAAQSNLLEPLRDFVKVHRKPTWGTCAGLVLLAEAANQTKQGGQELIGGLDVRVNRNHFGRQVESFQAELNLPFLADAVAGTNVPFPGVFIRAPIVEKILPNVDGAQTDEERLGGTMIAPSKEARDAQAQRTVQRHVIIMGLLPSRLEKAEQWGEADTHIAGEIGDIIAVKQGNVFGTSFHPELTPDARIHVWWLKQVRDSMMASQSEILR